MKVSPSLNPNPDPKDFFLVAEDFRKERHLKKAIHYYIRTLNSPISSVEERASFFQRTSSDLHYKERLKKQN